MEKPIMENLIPPVGLIFNVYGILYRVCYRNVGQGRASFEPVAVAIKDADGKPQFGLVDGSDRILSPDEFTAYVKERWNFYDDSKVQQQQNPGNVTLDVHSKPLGSGSHFTGGA